jgi:hypothetical protein
MGGMGERRRLRGMLPTSTWCAKLSTPRTPACVRFLAAANEPAQELDVNIANSGRGPCPPPRQLRYKSFGALTFIQKFKLKHHVEVRRFI